MSTIVKYSNGSTYTLVPNKVDVEKVQDLDGQYHIPYSSIVGMMRLGLGVQKITVSGDALDMSACLWHDVVAISFDSGTSYQTVYFAGVPYTSDCWSGIYPYALSLLASPLKEQSATRYPTNGYKWGNQSITGISQAGNVNAFPTIHFLAPLFYAPLSNTLIDFAGQSVTFTRTVSKVHAGVLYSINTPIFDNGLYLASDTSQDVAVWTPPASTLRTIAMQIKSRWNIGTGSPTNLITNGDFEANTTGWTGENATLSRVTVAPLAGTGSLKVLLTSNGGDTFYAITGLAIGHVYAVAGKAKSTAAAGRKVLVLITGGGSATGVAVDCSAPQIVSLVFVATATTGYPAFKFDSGLTGESILLDSVICYDLTALGVPFTLTVWTAALNKLTVNVGDGLLKWTDDTTTVNATFPTVAYLSGSVIDIVVEEDTAHAITVIAHAAAGNWYAAAGNWYTATGTLAALTWPQLSLGNLEGSIANLVEYPYVLTATEYQALTYSSLSLLFNTLYVGNRYAGEIVKGSDKRLQNANGSDISALLGGSDIAIGATPVTIAQSQGLSARWYVEVKRTDV